MSDNTRSLIFLLVMALIVGNVLAGISLGLKDRVEKNKEMMRVRSLLDVLDVRDRENKTDEQLFALYERVIRQDKQAQPTLYLYQDRGQTLAYAFDIGGRGLWDKIKGFLAVEKDGLSVRGIRFYEQSETPGLGGDIGTPRFERLFQNKKISRQGEFLHIVKAGSKAELSTTEVDGITGATLTCEAVNKFLTPAIERFQKRLEQIK